MSDTINITTTIVEDVVEITTTDNQTVVNVITQPAGTVTKTSDLINDGEDGTSTYVESADLADVATSGSYNDLINKPTIPAAQIQSDWNQVNNTALDFIKNKPTIPETPNIEQVLNVSDREVITHDVTTGDFTFDATHVGKYIGFYGVGRCDAIIPDDTYDPDIWVNLVGGVGEGAYINLVRTGGAVSTIIGHEKRIIHFEAKLTDPLANGWVVDAEPVSQFEIQLTQADTVKPDIVADSIIGAMGANISTTYNSDGDYYIVSDLPIFANVKEYIKNGAYQKLDFITVFFGFNTYAVTVRYVDDYTLQVNTYNYLDFFSVYLMNNVISEPFLIQIPFKP